MQKSELPVFSKKPKKLSNYQLSKKLPFFPKKSKKLNKRQILKYILPLYDTVGISRSQYAHKGYAETYNVDVADKISLSDSLFLAKSSIIDLFKDLLQEKRGFKYTPSTTITLKVCNNATNTYDIEDAHFNAKATTATNQKFNLAKPFEELKHKLDIWVREVQDG